MRVAPIPVLSIVGYSGSGKTTLIEQVIPLLAARGLTIGTAKHHHRMVQVDVPGKDSARHARAGARVVALAGTGGLAIFAQDLSTKGKPLPADPDLQTVVARAHAAAGSPFDLILAEGFTQEARVAIQLAMPDGDLRPVHKSCEVLAILDLHAKKPARKNSRPRFPRTQLQAVAARIHAWLLTHRRTTVRTVMLTGTRTTPRLAAALRALIQALPPGVGPVQISIKKLS